MHLPPQRDEAQQHGCTCKWYGRGAIYEFDAACPILDFHMRPPDSPPGYRPGQLRLEVA